MTVKIVNELMPEEEGIVFDNVTEAESALAYMIADYQRRGFSVTESDDRSGEGPQYFVIDRSRRPFGRYRIERKKPVSNSK
jgi:hypothetical protein